MTGNDIWIPKLSLKESHDINALTAFIKNYTPEAKLGEYVGSEAQFTLPFSSASIFPDLFRAIDANEVGFHTIVADHTPTFHLSALNSSSVDRHLIRKLFEANWNRFLWSVHYNNGRNLPQGHASRRN